MKPAFTDISNVPGKAAPEPVPYSDPAEVEASKRIAKHWSDGKFKAYMTVIDLLIQTSTKEADMLGMRYITAPQEGDQTEFAKAVRDAKKLKGTLEIFKGINAIKRISQDHSDTIDAVERVTFHRSDPRGSYKQARDIGRKVVKAAGFPGLRVLHTCAPLFDQTDYTWLAIAFSGLHPEWVVEEVDITRAGNTFTSMGDVKTNE